MNQGWEKFKQDSYNKHRELCYIMSNLWCHYYIDLPAPNNVRARALSHSSVEVTWDQLCDATEYIISYSTTASHISSGMVTVKGCSGTLTNLEGNTPYTITVHAMTSDGKKSAHYSEVSVRTLAAGKTWLQNIITP